MNTRLWRVTYCNSAGHVQYLMPGDICKCLKAADALIDLDMQDVRIEFYADRLMDGPRRIDLRLAVA